MNAAGINREWLVFQDATETTDASGNPVKNWIDRPGVWGRVAPFVRGSGESNIMNEIVSTSKKVITVNYRTDVTAKTRIFWRGDTWNIHYVEPNEDKFEMEVFASRVQ